MDLKKLFQDDDAVSPVIGVILMVAITVILAAVIASFVLNLGGSQSTTPQASFEFQDSEGSGSGSDDLADGSTTGELSITHQSGDSIDAARLTIVDNDDSDVVEGDTSDGWGVTEISSGDVATIEVDSDDTVRVVYTDDSGEDSTTLATWEGPDA